MKDYLLGWLIILACIGICVGIFMLSYFWSIVIILSVGILTGCHFLAKELGTFISHIRESKEW